MSRPQRFFAVLSALVALIGAHCSFTATSFGQPASVASGPPELPTNPAQWINSRPLSYEGLRGKAAVLWYFEETCPKCAGKWPGLKQLAAEHAEDPVLFIAVNSGRNPRELGGYLQTHEIDWPVIVDTDRSFETASGVGEISLQKIYQVRVVKPDGQFAAGRWDDMPGTVTKALEGAAWKVKYDKLHPLMHPAVRRMEFGDYRPAAMAIVRGMKDGTPEVRRAAGQVAGFVQRQMKQSLEEKLKDVPADDAWGQYEARMQVAEQFSPHELPKEAMAELKKLARDPKVQEENRAAKAVEANATALSSPDERIRQRAENILKRVVEKYPNTRSAARARELLNGEGQIRRQIRRSSAGR